MSMERGAWSMEHGVKPAVRYRLEAKLRFLCLLMFKCLKTGHGEQLLAIGS